MLYNNRKFAKLEELADYLRRNKARFDNGSWKIFHFYTCLECRNDERESMWTLHDNIHREWISAYPESITARVAYADFLVTYAWQARKSGDIETRERLYQKRLEAALDVLNRSAKFPSLCPMWWRTRLVIARNQGWSHWNFHQLFEEAKVYEPEFWGFDSTQSKFLLPSCYGAPGEWEYVAETEAKRPGSMGYEGYARVVMDQADCYDDIFKETKASWPETRVGCEELRRKYPRSLEILNAYCQLACSAKDRPLARKLFEEINGRMDLQTWRTRDRFVTSQNWAYAP